MKTDAKKTETRLEDIEKRLSEVEEKTWARNNPPKFKQGDAAYILLKDKFLKLENIAEADLEKLEYGYRRRYVHFDNKYPSGFVLVNEEDLYTKKMVKNLIKTFKSE